VQDVPRREFWLCDTPGYMSLNPHCTRPAVGDSNNTPCLPVNAESLFESMIGHQCLLVKIHICLKLRVIRTAARMATMAPCYPSDGAIEKRIPLPLGYTIPSIGTDSTRSQPSTHGTGSIHQGILHCSPTAATNDLKLRKRTTATFLPSLSISSLKSSNVLRVKTKYETAGDEI
jgi:hypothetical protein